MMPEEKKYILMCADYEVPVDPITHIRPQRHIVHDLQST
jgi:hypothetical protein